MSAEGQNEFAGAGIDGLQEIVAGEEQAPVGVILTLPIIDAAVGDQFGTGLAGWVQISLPVAASRATMDLFLAIT